MKKISHLLMAASFVLLSVACNSNNTEGDHGHEHGTGTHSHEETEAHGHEHEAAPQQEEFIIQGDSAAVRKDTTQQHTHEDGSTHDHH